MFITDDAATTSMSRFRSAGRTGVFSLSSPTPDSPAFYVGLEDHIVEVGVTEDIVQFADPVFEDPYQMRSQGKSKNVNRNVFRRRRQPIDLVLYEHPQASDPRTGNLRYAQVPPWSTNDHRDPPPGWDRRWRNASIRY